MPRTIECEWSNRNGLLWRSSPSKTMSKASGVWVVPSMRVGPLKIARGPVSITWGPEPGMSKAIVVTSRLAFAQSTASSNPPGAVAAATVTVQVDA